MNISKNTIPYIRVLGFNENGKYLLSQIKNKNPNIKIITSVKKFINSNTDLNLNLILEKDIFATDIYTLGYKKMDSAKLDFTHNVINIEQNRTLITFLYTRKVLLS